MASVIKGGEFVAKQAWGSQLIANMNGITTRVHWTDQPYKWHTNEGEEVFVVLAGLVEMKYRLEGAEHCVVLGSGDIFYASAGTEHVAHPKGEARVLVVETEGSV
ncbi:Cupin domain protein [Pseudovibrio axinellae]|uniref:Cupin domain protein n=1 Tax=Pseudovibrio axinellae TaxID=989403 RepID=A0A165YNU2_9HYPH|nr:cupin domain-containing protein [Pseudovibrio axinellae]KZL19022.1 Cupin domain protein [Pseudovibrio axinellae]SEP83505.1 Mannose-6-phosphate isomerase, cupin superfamily [Pseudovibrio axinellae]